MAHLLYQTEGLVLGASDTGEASRLVALFTRDFGLVNAHVQGVRLLKSKLRYSLQPLAWSNFSLVRGRELWRLVNAQANYPGTDTLLAETKIGLINLVELLRRLLQGEEKNPLLFKEVKEFVNFLAISSDLREVDQLTNLVAVRVLYTLGYVARSQVGGGELLLTLPWARELTQIASAKKELLAKVVAASFAHSQL